MSIIRIVLHPATLPVTAVDSYRNRHLYTYQIGSWDSVSFFLLSNIVIIYYFTIIIIIYSVGSTPTALVQKK